jgi:hypothetical protein
MYIADINEMSMDCIVQYIYKHYSFIYLFILYLTSKQKQHSAALVRERTIPANELVCRRS